MIFFIHHHACAAREVHRGPASNRPLTVETSELAAYEMTLVQQQPIVRRQLIDANKNAFVERANSTHRFTHLRENPQSLSITRAAGKRVALEIARESHASRDHDVRRLARSVEP